MNVKLSLSIVSHGHKRYIHRLLEDLARLKRADIEVILTLNLPEALPADLAALPFNVTLIENDSPKGFAENHNAAFERSRGDHFVILNPDLKFIDDPFDTLLSLIEGTPDCICAPLIVNEHGGVEDSARSFPTPAFLLKKLFSRLLKLPLHAEVVPRNGNILMPDWVAGMFIVVPRATYAKLKGLSERYHLYFEDVDFCARARLMGYQILVSEDAKVIHEAQRDSRRKLRYFMWHLHSAAKFFTSGAYLRIRLNRFLGTTLRASVR
jgi:N-acetylglucosaminyl-diphospho-decaprenol L-rhamnosyltransferase